MREKHQIAALEQQLAEANADLVSLREEVASYKQTIAAFPGVQADYNSKLEKDQADHKVEIDALKNLLKETESSVNRRVAESLASIGVAQFAPEEIISVESSASELYMKFLSLKGEAQTEFYRKHEKALSNFPRVKPNI